MKNSSATAWSPSRTRIAGPPRRVPERSPQPARGGALSRTALGKPGGGRERQRDQRRTAPLFGEQRGDGAAGRDDHAADRGTGHEADRERRIADRIAFPEQSGGRRHGNGRRSRQRPRGQRDHAVDDREREHRREREVRRNRARPRTRSPRAPYSTGSTSLPGRLSTLATSAGEISAGTNCELRKNPAAPSALPVRR